MEEEEEDEEEGGCIAVGLSRNFSAFSEGTDRRSVMKTNSSAAERKEL